jgi:adenylate cyclase
LTLVVGVFGLRAIRVWRLKQSAFLITYPGRRTIAAPTGFTILEASRYHDMPHESVCGGRGRCSTCRIRIIDGAQFLPEPDLLERRTLERVGAPPNVRLACQVRPRGDITVEPLVRAKTRRLAVKRYNAAVEGGREIEIAAMFVDLRESTKLAGGRLPFDALFLFDRYIEVVTGAISENDGHVTSIAGDGVMSVFGGEGSAANAARNAFQAALAVWHGLEVLNRDLVTEFGVELRAGIGLHVGVAVVGRMTNEARSLQFLGDVGNIAAKLEELSKELVCTLVATTEALKLISPDAIAVDTATVQVAGKYESIEVAVFREKGVLERVIVTNC